MKKIIALLLLTSIVRADIPADGSNIFTTDSKTVVISSITTSPTQILTQDSFITRTWIVNNSSFTVFISSTNATINTNTAPSIPPCVASTSCAPWTPDGPVIPYWGQMWAVQNGSSTSTTDTLSIIRFK